MKEIIDFLKKYTDGKQNTEKMEISVLQLNRIIKALEQETNSSEKLDKWIPCSERLPEEGVSVLVYAERNAYDGKGKFRKKVIDIGWQVDGHWHIDGCNGVVGIAWMPLPEQYKEVRNDD